MRDTIERLGLLPVFVEVVRQGSFTAAAAQLGLPKSTVSRRVARLERELGATLLARTTRQLRLTDAGADLYEQAAPALDKLEDAARALSERQRTPRGTLRVTAPVDVGHELLGEMVASFVARYPAVSVELTLTGRVVDLIAEGFDCAIRAGRLRESSGLVARKVSQSDLGLFAAPGYLERRGAPTTLADLTEHDCVLFRVQGGRTRWTLDGPGGPESVEVRGTVSADDFAFVRALIRAGAGIGLVPTLGLAPSEMVRVLPEYAMNGGAISVVYPRSRHVPARVTAFRDHVVDAFRVAPLSQRA